MLRFRLVCFTRVKHHKMLLKHLKEYFYYFLISNS